MHWSDCPLFFIDFEGCLQGGVVEVGVLCVLGGEVQWARSRLCRGDRPIRAMEKEQHGVGDAMVAHCQHFAVEREWVIALRQQGLWVAHNAVVEEQFLKSLWPYPPAVPAVLSEGSVSRWGPWVDTYRLYQRCYPGLESYRLQDLVDTFALRELLHGWVRRYCPGGRRKPHCALYDALASQVLLRHLSQQDGFAEMDVAWLVQHSAPSEEAFSAFQQGELW